VLGFLAENNLPYLPIRYEDLIVRPVETVRELNVFLGTNLSVKDLESVYHRPLFKDPRPPLLKYVKAILIYVKNHPRWSSPSPAKKRGITAAPASPNSSGL
jgi:hypothetical protein